MSGQAPSTGMVFDLICRACGCCEQRRWDPSAAVTVTSCPGCGQGMTVIGIDFPVAAEQRSLKSVLEVIQGAGIVPLAVQRRSRGRRRPAAEPDSTAV